MTVTELYHAKHTVINGTYKPTLHTKHEEFSNHCVPLRSHRALQSYGYSILFNTSPFSINIQLHCSLYKKNLVSKFLKIVFFFFFAFSLETIKLLVV